MPDTEIENLPILRELRHDLAAAYAERERRPVRARRTRLLAVAGVAAALVAVVAALPGGDRGATAILDAAAATAAEQRSTVPPPGAYAYFSERGTGSVATVREWWVARDGSGRLRERMTIGNDFERPANDPGLPRWKQSGPSWVRDTRFGPGEFAATHARAASTVLETDVTALPTDPGALEQALRSELRAAAQDSDPETGFAGGTDPASWHLLTVIEQTLAHPLASPELRSALYRVAARLDGVEAAENVEDPIGRPASVLRLVRQTNPGSVRNEVYFDPDTAATLATASRITSGLEDVRVYTPPTVTRSLSRP
jgi:hypothetical protein